MWCFEHMEDCPRSVGGQCFKKCKENKSRRRGPSQKERKPDSRVPKWDKRTGLSANSRWKWQIVAGAGQGTALEAWTAQQKRGHGDATAARWSPWTWPWGSHASSFASPLGASAPNRHRVCKNWNSQPGWTSSLICCLHGKSLCCSRSFSAAAITIAENWGAQNDTNVFSLRLEDRSSKTDEFNDSTK